MLGALANYPPGWPTSMEIDIPCRQLPRLTVGQLHISDGTATVTDHHGTAHVIVAAADPVQCGPCTLVRWRRVLNAEARHKSLPDLYAAASDARLKPTAPISSTTPGKRSTPLLGRLREQAAAKGGRGVHRRRSPPVPGTEAD